MTTRPIRPMPTWFVLLVAFACAWLLRATLPADAPALPSPQLAFFGWLILIAEAVWTGVQAAGQVSLAILTAIVHTLSVMAGYLFNAALEIGRGVANGFRVAWGFLKTTYENVLKPGWTKFFGWVDRARHWLENFFAPVFKFLRDVRNEILGFYEHWVRPVLDTIEIVRKGLSVFVQLGFEWARKLDGELARLEERIDAPFQFALRKINEAIGIIDRIVTADGLFQRLALVKSIERDIAYVHQAWLKAAEKNLSPADVARRRAEKYHGVDPAAPGVELRKLYTGGDGQYAAVVGELVPLWRISAGIDRSQPPVN